MKIYELLKIKTWTKRQIHKKAERKEDEKMMNRTKETSRRPPMNYLE